MTLFFTGGFLVLDLPSKWWSVVSNFPILWITPPKSGWTNYVYELTSFHFWWKFRRFRIIQMFRKEITTNYLLLLCVLTPNIDWHRPWWSHWPIQRWGWFFRFQIREMGMFFFLPVKTRGVSVLAKISYPVKLGYSCDFFMLFILFFMLFINIIYLCLISSCKMSHLWSSEKQWNIPSGKLT